MAPLQEGMTVLRNIPVYVDKQVELHRDLLTDASTHYVKLRVDDGLTWEAAKERRDAVRDEMISKGASPTQLKQNGFYISRNEWAAWKRYQIILCTEVANDGRSNLTKYRVQRPYQNSRSGVAVAVTGWERTNLLSVARSSRVWMIGAVHMPCVYEAWLLSTWTWMCVLMSQQSCNLPT
eukprot:1138300-Pelagomonas_calceolata.AAC.2